MNVTRRNFLGMTFAAAGSLAMGGLLAGCGSSGAAASSAATSSAAGTSAAVEKTDIIIGLRSDGIDQYAVVEDEIKAAGFNPTTVLFDDSVQPDVALGEGSIDCNWYQHEPYMQAYNAENGTDFVMIQPKTAAPLFAMYSSKIKSPSDLKDGATIALCNDATNQSRGLHLLESLGLITLPSGSDVVSIVEINAENNPHGFKFIEGEMQLLPQSMNDVDAICLAAAHMVNAGYDANDYVAKSSDEEEYAVGFAVRSEDKDAAWAKKLAEAVQCDDLATYFAEEKQGVMVPLWK